ncbi:hypothetical protein Pden_4950 (plasmid) [Paracoccus denitrificans PD1222]|uniref:Uncharacterized protein n=1 Tax=Paracoccus denitrificans (strain Pd 1222) TaxID=318586 RepID=A1BBW6_PARDP|nr:hypothetical protein Pden_4950 [Paracoccus denitrificans PD1222]
MNGAAGQGGHSVPCSATRTRSGPRHASAANRLALRMPCFRRIAIPKQSPFRAIQTGIGQAPDPCLQSHARRAVLMQDGPREGRLRWYFQIRTQIR